VDEGMRQGLNGEGDGLLFIIKINKNYRRRGKTGQLAGLARQGNIRRRTGTALQTQDYKRGG